ncbi:MAG: hypothetical protein KA791_10680, partial [Flavobacteriales bacterium]|nr:hypothetical protein [Flavobacteriales bacterium]
VMQWLVYGHVWLALCVAAQVWWTGLFMAGAPELWRYNVAAALGTVAGYGFMRWVRSREPKLRASAHLSWFSERYTLMLVICVACALGAAVLCWPPRWTMLRWLLAAGVLAILYVSPFTAKDGLTIGLRRVPGLKLFIIAIVWVLAVVAVPMEYDAAGHSPSSIAFMMCMRLPLFLALVIAFDIRDMPYDPPVLRTLPQLMGARGAKLAALLLLTCSAVFEHVFLRSLDYTTSAWLILPAYAIAALLIVRAAPGRGALYYAILMDGMLILIPVAARIGMGL